MERHLFNPSDPISILDFIQTFKRACDNLSIHEGAAVFLTSHFMQGSAKQDLLHHLEGASNDEIDDDNTSGCALCCYDEVVNHLLQTYANDDIISATDSAIRSLKQRENQSPIKDVVFMKMSRCGRVYCQTDRIHRFLQGLNDDVQHHTQY